VKLTAEQERIIESVGLSPLAMVLSNPNRPDNPLEVINSAFCSLTGYSEREVLGRNCRFLAGGATDRIASAQLRNALQQRKPVLIDILNYRRDGSAFRNGVMIAPIYNAEGDLVWFLGSQVDLGPSPSDLFAQRRSSAAELVSNLPPRQRQVLQAMAGGLLNKQIAWRLKISEKTVKMHRSLLIERLGVGTSAEAIRIAVEAGL
jgi:PAS domain S-box-containing protein